MPGPRYIGPSTCWNWPCIHTPGPTWDRYYFAIMGAMLAAGLTAHIANFLLKHKMLPGWAVFAPVPAFLLAIVPLWKFLVIK
jgi:hypothetical protein